MNQDTELVLYHKIFSLNDNNDILANQSLFKNDTSGSDLSFVTEAPTEQDYATTIGIKIQNPKIDFNTSDTQYISDIYQIDQSHNTIFLCFYK